jgi:hypothetical protein
MKITKRRIIETFVGRISSGRNRRSIGISTIINLGSITMESIIIITGIHGVGGRKVLYF